VLSDKFLIDECLSVALVAAAKGQGRHADHMTYLGKAGWQDWNVTAFALANDYVFVTKNRRDFLRAYAQAELHNGLIIIVPDAKRLDQRRLFVSALAEIDRRNNDIVNMLIEVLVDGSVHVRKWTRLGYDLEHISSPKWGRE
jgi:predicted nuclease of predicted toxin-antitoxin system